MKILPVDHHGDHKVGHIVFILGENIAKYKDMSSRRRLTKIGDLKCCREAHLPLQHHGDCRMSPIVSILSDHVS